MRLSTVGLLLAGTWATARAQSPGFRIDHWTTDNGLPSHTISDIAQSRDGYLWLATPGGLVRTDGVSFTTYTTASHPELRENRARAVYAGNGDTVWVLLERQGIFAFTGGRFRHVVENSTSVDYVVQDGAGALIGGLSTVFRLDGAARRMIGRVNVAENPLRPFAARDEAESVLGKSPLDALREYRLDQAAQWLRETDAYVSEVAYGVGFKSVPHFCSRFRERFGVTPSAYRAEKPAGLLRDLHR